MDAAGLSSLLPSCIVAAASAAVADNDADDDAGVFSLYRERSSDGFVYRTGEESRGTLQLIKQRTITE